MPKPESPALQPITIKLLNERRGARPIRKIDGRSGFVYPFRWDAEHGAYVFTTTKVEELDDIFNTQGRALGSYFAPVFMPAAPAPAILPLNDLIAGELIVRDIVMPATLDALTVATALIATYDRVLEAATAKTADAPPAAGAQPPAAIETSSAVAA